MDVPMTLIVCAHCGQPFAISEDREERLRKCHNTFYCPDGHPQSFPAKTDEEKLREQVAALKQEKAALEEKARAALQKKTSKRTKEGK